LQINRRKSGGPPAPQVTSDPKNSGPVQAIVNSLDLAQGRPQLSINGQNDTLDKFKRIVWPPALTARYCDASRLTARTAAPNPNVDEENKGTFHWCITQAPVATPFITGR
jgi:hypothetical protein